VNGEIRCEYWGPDNPSQFGGKRYHDLLSLIYKDLGSSFEEDWALAKGFPLGWSKGINPHSLDQVHVERGDQVQIWRIGGG
jgi:hypothetical protein